MSRHNFPEVNELSTSTKSSMRTRLISAFVGLLIIFPVIFIGDWAYFLFVIFLAIVASIEIVNCVKPAHSFWIYLGTILFVTLITIWPFFQQTVDSLIFNSGWKLWTCFESLYISLIMVVISIFISFFFVIIDKDTTVGDASFIFVIGLIVAIGLQSFLYLRFYPIVDYYDYSAGSVLPSVSYFNIYENLESSTLFLYVCSATFLADTGAYFTGIFFGKHKMSVTISPKKTWEGFFGGILFSAILSFLFAFILAATNHPLLSFLDVNHWYFILILSLLIPVLSTLGDFVFSSFKRYYGIKDFGKIIPGHGGILDRIDSLSFTTMFAAIVIGIVAGNGSPLL